MSLVLSSDTLSRIDAVCESFEDELQRGGHSNLAQYVPEDWPYDEQQQLVRFLLELDIHYRRQRGEFVSRLEYQQRVPQFLPAVDAAFGNDAAELRQIGPYRLGQVLGSGGMGMVYKAFHSRLERFVALKILPPEVLHHPQARERFNREMGSVGRLSHPNIVVAHDAGEVDGVCYLAMELVSGYNLAELLQRHGRLRVADACELIRQAALGLDHVHEHGLVHRDIKPSNLMLTGAGQVKILDLGLALAGGDTRELSSGHVTGTIDYMAPEQFADSQAVDIRADIYSLGVTLYKLLCGHLPHARSGKRFRAIMGSDNVADACRQRPIRESCVDLPEILCRIVDRMLALDPERRYATPAEVASRLAPFCEGSCLAALLLGSCRGPSGAVDTVKDGSLESTADSLPALAEAPARRAGTGASAAVLATTSLVSHSVRRLVLVAGAAALLPLAAVMLLDGQSPPSRRSARPFVSPGDSSAIAARQRRVLEWIRAAGGDFELSYGQSFPADRPLPTRLSRLFRVELKRSAASTAEGDDIVDRLEGVQPEWLGINVASFTAAGVKRLSESSVAERIHDLTFTDCDFDDNAIPQLARIRGVTQICFFSMPLTGETIASLSDLPHLELLTFISSALTPEGIEQMGSLEKLSYLNIDGTVCTELHAEAISRLNLTTLIANDAGMNDACLEHLAGMNGLERMSAARNRITDVGLRSLQRLRSLKELLLTHNEISKGAVAQLHAALPKCKIVSDFGTLEPK